MLLPINVLIKISRNVDKEFAKRIFFDRFSVIAQLLKASLTK